MQTDNLAVSIHGPAGVVDLIVPPGAQAVDLAREYAEQSGLASIPLIYSLAGQPLRPDLALDQAGVSTGDILVAATGVHRPRTGSASHASTVLTGSAIGAGVWFSVAGIAAVLAGWFGAQTEGGIRQLSAAVLLGAAVIGILPAGEHAARRALAAPAFAAAAAFALVWSPVPERLPLILGITGIAAAVAASAGRALTGGPDEGLKVWIVVGAGLLGVTGVVTLLGWSPQVAYALLIVTAMLAARFVPMFAIDVPDQYLLDLDRLAVNAWSAREQPTGKRGRTMVHAPLVTEVAHRGARTVTAACVAVAVLVGLCSWLLLRDTDRAVDVIGARLVVLFAAAATLLAARSYRHVAARTMLRAGGLLALAVLAADVVVPAGELWRLTLALVSTGLGLVLVVAAVATGRGWRSVWWSRRAEVAEGFCAAAALACLVVSTGLFRSLWEMGT